MMLLLWMYKTTRKDSRGSGGYLQLLLLIFILFNLSIHPFTLFSQENDFEVNIANDSIKILPRVFVRGINDDYVGIVSKAPLYGEARYYSGYLYTIDESGDTTSVCLAKVDTVCDYYDMIKVNIGEPGYLLSGLAKSKETEPGTDVYNIFTRLDANLNILWEKKYYFYGHYAGWMLKTMQLTDSSFMNCTVPYGDNMFLFQFSYSGDSLAYRMYTGDSSGWINSITYNSDSSAIWLHTNWAHCSGNNGQINSCIEIDSQLNQTKVFYYPAYYDVYNFTSKLLPNGSLVTCGNSTFTLGPDIIERYLSVFKLDSDFNVLNFQYLTNPDTMTQGCFDYSIDYYYQSCIYVGGTHNSKFQTSNEPSWYYVAKLNESLELEFEKYIGGDKYYTMNSVTATKDGGVLLIGWQTAIGAQDFIPAGYIIKLDSTGCITSLPNNSSIQIKDVLVYPNPGIESLKVRTTLKDCALTLFDIKGVRVLTMQLDNHITEINTTMLSPGTYMYVIEQEGKEIDSGKWIKQK